jgi:hypothetical protein
MATPQQQPASGDNLTSLDELLRQAQQGQGGDQQDDIPDQYQQLLQTAPPDVIEQAHADAFAQLSVEERRSIAESLRAANDDPNQAFQFTGFTGGEQDTDPQQLAAMFARAQQQQPDLLGSILGRGNGGSGNPLMQMVLSTVATLVMQRLLGGAASQNTGQFGGSGGLGSILGQILGGAAGAGGLGSSTGRQGGQGGEMTSLDDLVKQRSGQGSNAPQPTSSGGGLEDLLGQLGAGGGGGGLGAILGQLATGMQGTDGARLADTNQGASQDPPQRF